jgi:hypothetical protein
VHGDEGVVIGAGRHVRVHGRVNVRNPLNHGLYLMPWNSQNRPCNNAHAQPPISASPMNMPTSPRS